MQARLKDYRARYIMFNRGSIGHGVLHGHCELCRTRVPVHEMYLGLLHIQLSHPSLGKMAPSGQSACQCLQKPGELCMQDLFWVLCLAYMVYGACKGILTYANCSFEPLLLGSWVSRFHRPKNRARTQLTLNPNPN